MKLVKVYQVHEAGGQLEDHYDNVVDSFFSKGNAKKRRMELQKSEGDPYKCHKCPLYRCPTDCQDDCVNCPAEEKANKYCNNFKKTDWMSCANYIDFDNVSEYYIQEIDVKP